MTTLLLSLAWRNPAHFVLPGRNRLRHKGPRLQTSLLSAEAKFGHRGLAGLATGRDNAMITAHPFDLSGSKIQASIKKVPSAAAYRCFIPASSEAQDLGVVRGRMLGAAVNMGAAGLPNAEHNPARDSFPCDYCEWKTRCQVVDKGNAGMVFPAIPEKWKYAPPGCPRRRRHD